MHPAAERYMHPATANCFTLNRLKRVKDGSYRENSRHSQFRVRNKFVPFAAAYK
jgi:hypothetical protein